MSQRESEFQQRLIASTVLQDPKLEIVRTLFPEIAQTSESVPEHGEINAEGDLIIFPTSEEEFEQMMEQFGIAED